MLDLNSDGDVEVIGGLYSLFMLDGATGTEITRIDPSGSRVWGDIAVADIDNDGDLEVVSVHSTNIHVWDHNLTPVWSRQPVDGYELRSLALYDLDYNGDLEIMVASTRSFDQWFVYEHNGNLRAGDWPQHSPDSDTNGYASGCFNQNIAAGDMNNDGLVEIIGSNDTHYTAAFYPNGSQVPAHSIYGTLPGGLAKPWSRVGMHVSHLVDLRGYATCGTDHRPNFAHSPPTLSDLDNDGMLELVIVGNVYNCGTSPYTDLYEMPFIFKQDRTRWSNPSYNWTDIPVPDGSASPRSEDYTVIESSHPVPVVADLDGDGIKEILYPSYDGRMHAYWLDKTEHGNWPFSVTKSTEPFLRFASPPVIADLDNNGQAEVIFASWVQKGTSQTGYLHILDYLGNPIHEIQLPAAFGSSTWNGVLASPTLANIDSDPDLEVVLTSAHSGFLAYDLPGTANARVLWATGRGNFLRSGSPIIQVVYDHFHYLPLIEK
ncbi:MAG: VCBS repeat-containing protein [Anaerolineaceae bacterium]|nr:VCBS repeat-containing protein [Anaerolineaceae bacterium]